MGPRVLVVGAGPTGLTLAGELAGRGIPVTVIDGLAEPAPHSRALVVHSRTQELLQRSGLRDAVAENAIEIRGMAFQRGSRTLSTVPFDLGRYPALSLRRWRPNGSSPDNSSHAAAPSNVGAR